MKPGERVIWLHSPRHVIGSGWRLQRIPGEVVRICRRRIRIRVCVGGRERLVNVDPENVLHNGEDSLSGDSHPCARARETGDRAHFLTQGEQNEKDAEESCAS